MDAAQALADLTEISPQIEAAVILDEAGAPLASTLPDDERAREVARLGQRLLTEADEVVATEQGKLTQLHVVTRSGGVFAVREGEHRVVATTSGDPTVGLIFYDLRSSLRSLHEEQHATP
jgi:predicted regulator of Ras-like GTPase activity (Roadblock/LC7/MglB family)